MALVYYSPQSILLVAGMDATRPGTMAPSALPLESVQGDVVNAFPEVEAVLC